MFYKQGWHFLFLLLLLIGVTFLAQGEVLEGSLWGFNTRIWLWVAIAVPVAHQVMVGLIWRGELYHGWMTRAFGTNGFFIYKVIFSVLFAARPISVLLLGISNFDSLACPPEPMVVVGVLLLLPFGYTMYSVVSYFGMDRAYGIDHFEPKKYRKRSFVKRGMFKYTDNAMYKFGFLILWSLALFTLSRAALLAAAFNHLYIWVHYYFTELPDINHIYGKKESQGAP
jgi:hypothetical protein